MQLTCLVSGNPGLQRHAYIWCGEAALHAFHPAQRWQQQAVKLASQAAFAPVDDHTSSLTSAYACTYAAAQHGAPVFGCGLVGGGGAKAGGESRMQLHHSCNHYRNSMRALVDAWCSDTRRQAARAAQADR